MTRLLELLLMVLVLMTGSVIAYYIAFYALWFIAGLIRDIPESPLWRIAPDATAITLAMCHVWMLSLILPVSRQRRKSVFILAAIMAATGYGLAGFQTLQFYPLRGLLFVPAGFVILIASYYLAYRWTMKTRSVCNGCTV